MSEDKIWKLLNERNVGNGILMKEFMELYKNSRPNGDTIEKILEETARYLEAAKCKLSNSEESEIFALVENCLMFLPLADNNHYVVERALYFITRDLINLNCHEIAIKISTASMKKIEKRLQDNSLAIPSNLAVVFSNWAKLLWNLGFTKYKDHSSTEDKHLAANITIHGFEFLMLFERNLCRIFEKASNVLKFLACVSKDEHECNIDEYLHAIESLSFAVECGERKVEMSSTSQTLLAFKTWIEHLIAILIRRARYNRECLILNGTVISMTKILQKAFDESNSELSSICLKCIDLITVGIQIAADFKSCHARKFAKICKNLSEVLTPKIAVEEVVIFKFALIIPKHLIHLLKTTSSLEIDDFSQERIYCLDILYSLSFYIMSMEKPCDGDCSNKSTVQYLYEILVMHLDLMTSALQSTINDNNFKNILSRSKLLIKPVTKFVTHFESEINKFANLGVFIGNIGTICFNQKLYCESIEFMELSCSISMKWCSLGDTAEAFSERLAKINLKNKHFVLLHSMRCSKSDEAYLRRLSEIIPYYLDDDPDELIERWVLGKTKAEIMKDWNEITLLSYNNNFELSKADLFKLLSKELKSCKIQPFNTIEAQHYVARDMLSVACQPLELSSSFLELARIEWFRSSRAKDIIDYCEKAMKILKKERSNVKSNIAVLNQLATAWFIKYLGQLRTSQERIKNEMSTGPIIPLEKKTLLENNFEQVDDFADEKNSDDIVPTYTDLTIETECENLKLLNEALNLWGKVILESKVPFLNSEQTVQDLQCAAHLYGLSSQHHEEIKAWRVASRLAFLTDSQTEYVVCASNLIEALCVVGEFREINKIFHDANRYIEKLNPESPRESYAYLKYYVTKAKFAFHKKNIEEGLKILKQFWTHAYFETKTRHALLLNAEMLLLAGQLMLLPRNLCSDESLYDTLPWKNTNSIELAIGSVNSLLTLIKHVHSGTFVKDDGILFSYRITALLLRAKTITANMYAGIGSPASARFLLKDNITLNQKASLGFRTAESLVELAQLDIMSNNLQDCKVKLNGVQYIMHSASSFSKSNEVHTMEERKLLKKLNIMCPDFISHSSSCNCAMCSIPSLQNIYLQILIIEANSLLAAGLVDNALLVSQFCLKLARKNAKNYYDEVQLSDILFCNSRLLFNKKNYSDSLVLVEEGILKLRRLRYINAKVFSLLPHMLYQRSLSSFHSLAVKQEKRPIELVSKFWSINGIPKDAESDTLTEIIASVQKLKLAGGDSLEANLRTVKKESTKNSSQNLCLAPKKLQRKSRSAVPVMTEPSDSEDENDSAKYMLKMQKKKAHLPKTVVVKSTKISINLSSSDDESKAMDNASKKLVQSTTKTHSKSLRNLLMLPVLSEEEHSNEDATVMMTPAPRSNAARQRNKENGSDDFATPFQKRSAARMPKQLETPNVPRRSKRLLQQSALQYENVENPRQDSSCSEEDDECGIDFEAMLEPIIPLIEKGDDISSIEIVRADDEEANEKNTKGLRNETNKTEDKEILREADEDIDFTIAPKTTLEYCYENTLEDVIKSLEEAFDFIYHQPPSNLYSNVCLLLALLKGRDNSFTSYYLSESPFVSLRHQCIINVNKKISKPSLDTNYFLDMENTLSALHKYREIMDFTNGKNMNLEMQLDNLPSDWRVCQLAIAPACDTGGRYSNPPLLIGRYQKNKLPNVLCTYDASRSSSEVLCSLLVEFAKIHEDSKESMKIQCKMKWWDARRNLNDRMKNFVLDMEDTWLGHWKGLLLGKPKAIEKQIELETAVQEISSVLSQTREVDRELLEVLVDSAPWLSDDQLKKGLIDLCGPFRDLHEWINTVREHSKILNSKSVVRHPVILLLGKDIECLPWENIPILRSHPASRMPSLKFLNAHLSWQCSREDSVYLKGVDKTKTYYVLNPGNDLSSTQETFESYFAEKMKWSGVVGRTPCESEFKQGLISHDLFIYCGHGTGRKYLSGDLIQRLYCTAVTLLMGCSSGKLTVHGPELEPNGTALHYLMAGCPCILADLWDVTDRDIDRFLETVLNQWLESSGDELTNVVPKARLVCRLPYLIGAAPIIYGLPAFVR